ncbi:hypothetical protein [Mycoplana rhizolycopersici]|uniref:Uncharacterized protein n=1 Tax=Mycoplana rhizolycopersici TaxID=2746702 RepID=A0ABX2Q9P5_9HYPH|nr:hypothetical protein [Rhizobium rhizolycopersici]NVP54441.1 hypothetical protein [Rhizobium rhizolycopersici]
MAGNRIQLPENTELASQLITEQSKERGFIGQLVGTKEHAPTNIAAIVLLLSLIALIATFFVGAAYPVWELGNAQTALGTIVTTTIGYLFGRHTSS